MVHFDVSGIKPNQVPYLETRDGEVAISRMSFILLEGELKLITKVLMQVLHVCSHFMSTLQWNRFKGNLKFWMEPFISEKWSDTCGQMLDVVVGKFCKREQVLPVVLLVVDEDPKVLFEDLVHPFHLPIGFRMIRCGEVSFDAK